MRKLLNILYVTTAEANISRDGENIVVSIHAQDKFRVPVHNLEGIVCFNYSGVSPSAIGLCCERGVPICFLSPTGRFLGRVTGGVSGNVLLRRRQYRAADHADTVCGLARAFVSGKILNSRTVLMRFTRDHSHRPGSIAVSIVADHLMCLWKGLAKCDNVDAVRGVEGDAARDYFSVFDNLITSSVPELRFGGRSRRPPLDAVNALLSFLYSLLSYDCASALETVGLDPQVGFLHRDRPGRLSLALDLMEELRPYLVDRFVVSLINNNQVSRTNFVRKETGAVLMDEALRKLVLTEWQKRKREDVMHPFLEERIQLGLIPYAQALLLARHLRGDLDGYPPFLMR